MRYIFNFLFFILTCFSLSISYAKQNSCMDQNRSRRIHDVELNIESILSNNKKAKIYFNLYQLYGNDKIVLVEELYDSFFDNSEEVKKICGIKKDEDSFGSEFVNTLPVDNYLFHEDRKKAIGYLTASANLGYPDAQFNLAIEYLVGRLLPKNDNLALEKALLSAKQGHSSAQELVGAIYGHIGWNTMDGQFVANGVALDPIRSYVWMNIASTSGSRTAVYWRDEIGKKLSASELIYAQNRSSKCLSNQLNDCD